VQTDFFLWELHDHLRTAYPGHRQDWPSIAMQFLSGAAYRHYTSQVQHFERMTKNAGMLYASHGRCFANQLTTHFRTKRSLRRELPVT
jgi:hypothetical protein